ncbi:uncharacterized protein [Lepisosteus oculatus]|uniref:uncharacterized protein n=1 Tax=Lepisosteus oculatus TaxID=7918 RepID=UPI000740550D|nr:PREDICTED: uncharacterized protein LOC107078054 [Lepisosteus oculatus]
MNRFLQLQILQLVLLVQCQVFAALIKPGGCPRAQKVLNMYCSDKRRTLDRLTADIANGIETSHDESILLPHGIFDRVRGTRWHGCILKEIILFYTGVLKNYKGHKTFTDTVQEDVMHTIYSLQQCFEVEKIPCENLKKMPVNETRCVNTLTPREVTKLQIQKLQRARHQKNDVKIQEKAIVELQGLSCYFSDRSHMEFCFT